MAYLLDANTFIQAKNAYYSFEVCPGFWDWVLLKASQRVVLSVEAIQREITAGTDRLATWAANEAAAMFAPPDPATVAAMKLVTAWMMAQPLAEQHRAAFFAKADPLLIAHAKAHGDHVVTHEVRAGPGTTKVKVPAVCDAMGVRCLDLFHLLGSEGARFVLATP